MAINLLALGSRGDVEPLAVLGGALTARGVETRLIALADHADLAAELDAPFVPIPASIADAIAQTHSVVGRLVLAGQLGQAVLLRRWLADIAPAVARTVVDVIEPGDTLLTGILSREVLASFAQARGCSVATIVHTAMLPTVHRESHWSPKYFTGWRPYDRWGSTFSWSVASTLGRPVGAAVADALGVSSPRGRAAATRAADAHPVLVAASPLLVPPAPDWAPTVHQTGHLATPPLPFTPSAELIGFLAQGPPVYVGFGSMAGSVGHHDLGVILDAAARTDRRIVTPALPGTAPGRVDDRVLTIGPTPFGWLFPRVAATVHHGGAGTTYAALLAGVPTVALPFGVDQPFHAQRLFRLGVGPEPFSIRRLTAHRLATLIGELTTSARAAAYRERAAAVGAQARAEDGLGATIALLERLGYV